MPQEAVNPYVKKLCRCIRLTLLAVLFAGPACVALAAELDESARSQLDTAEDHSARLDDGAWYPLIRDAMTWTPGDVGGAAAIPWDSLREHPAEHRGRLFLIRGILDRSRPFGLARSGPWGETLTEWVMRVPVDTSGAMEVAVVYLAGHAQPAPRAGDRVRTVGRFYKLWRDSDAQGHPVTYLTFVGGWGEKVGSGVGSRSATVSPPALLVGGTAALMAVLLLLRSTLKRREAIAARRHDGWTTPQEEEGKPRLPGDPASALEELHRRNDA